MRAVTCDHILFDECIEAFRPPNKDVPIMFTHPGESYLLTDFELTHEWKLPNAIIYPSETIYLPGPNAAFISKVIQPNGCLAYGHHLFTIALSAIISFVTGRTCKATRDDYSPETEMLTDISELALVHPVRVSGLGSINPSISSKKLSEHCDSVCSLISQLLEIDIKSYRKAMQSIRLTHLSMLNKKDDFGLAYLLVVSGIEAIAQHAIKEKSVKRRHPLEDEWKKRSMHDSEFAQLFSEYKHSRSFDKCIKDRYVKFIEDYAPYCEWDKFVEDPSKDSNQRFAEMRERNGLPPDPANWGVRSSRHQIVPSEISTDDLSEILRCSYNHRSCFVHRGEQPPHKSPNSSNLFFDILETFESSQIDVQILPTYSLMLGISQRSISGWIKAQSENTKNIIKTKKQNIN